MQLEAATVVRRVKDIEYRLLPGTARQTTDIVIERDDRVSVRPPARMTPEQVDETVLSRKCLMAPPKITDYIVVHELCHLRHRDHSDLF